MVWLIVFAAFLLLGVLPLGFRAQYTTQTAVLYLVVGPLWLPINSGSHKKKETSRASSQDSFASHEKATKKDSTRKPKDYLPLLKPVFEFLRDFKRKLRVNDLRLKVVLAGDDPCDLSINYGRAWMALGNLIPLLERYFVIKRRNLEIECDYTADSTTVDAVIHVTITLGRILMIVIYHGISILSEYFRIIKKTKDGAMS